MEPAEDFPDISGVSFQHRAVKIRSLQGVNKNGN